MNNTMFFLPFFDRTILKFICVGLFNTAISAVIMFFSYNCLNLSYWISSALAYCIGIICSFFLNKYITFQNHHKSVLQVLLFIACTVTSYLIAFTITKNIFSLLSDSQEFKDNISMIAGMILYTMLNYMGQRFIIFRKERKCV